MKEPLIHKRLEDLHALAHTRAPTKLAGFTLGAEHGESNRDMRGGWQMDLRERVKHGCDMSDMSD